MKIAICDFKDVSGAQQLSRIDAELLAADQEALTPNSEDFDCSICFGLVKVKEGVVLKECLHAFCRYVPVF
jgi:hypothetical protein